MVFRCLHFTIPRSIGLRGSSFKSLAEWLAIIVRGIFLSCLIISSAQDMLMNKTNKDKTGEPWENRIDFNFFIVLRVHVRNSSNGVWWLLGLFLYVICVRHIQILINLAFVCLAAVFTAGFWLCLIHMFVNNEMIVSNVFNSFQGQGKLSLLWKITFTRIALLTKCF